jgi:hypothetical protein
MVSDSQSSWSRNKNKNADNSVVLGFVQLQKILWVARRRGQGVTSRRCGSARAGEGEGWRSGGAKGRGSRSKGLRSGGRHSVGVGVGRGKGGVEVGCDPQGWSGWRAARRVVLGACGARGGGNWEGRGPPKREARRSVLGALPRALHAPIAPPRRNLHPTHRTAAGATLSHLRPGPTSFSIVPPSHPHSEHAE